MTLLRTPEGVFSEQVLAQAQGMGYKTVFWSFAYKDWDPNNQMATSTAYQKAVAGIHPGAIYLLHAVSKTNAAILGDLIDEMRRQGYTFGVLQ
jgi:peptidoglycan-N-acetylmuramic acid deacetylase